MENQSNKVTALKSLLLMQTLITFAYTIYVAQHSGWDLFSIFTTNIISFGWNGQFNLDFSCYLLLSGLWLMWRNHFSTISIFLGICSMIIGIIFFAPCLLYLLIIEKGNISKVLLGNR